MTRSFAAAAVLLFALPAVAAAQATSHAGTDHSGHHAAGAGVKGFEGDFAAHFKGIDLTEAQKAKMVALRDEWHAKMKVVTDEATKAGKAKDAAVTAKVDALKAQEHASFRALLTAAQQAQFDKNMKEHDAMDSHKKKDGQSRPV
jgi:Spy/CpxP family protein refolding chaperone